MSDPGHLCGEGVQLIHHRVDGVLLGLELSAHVHRDLLGQVAHRDGGRDLGDVACPVGQVAGHQVDVVGQVLPRAGDPGHVGLAAKLALRPDFVGDSCHLRGQRAELVDHRVDGVLELEDLALDVDGDLAAQVTLGDSGRDLGDVADLAGEVAGHRVDVVGQVLPRAGHATHVGLTAELPFGADFAGHAGDLRGEGVELVDHRVDGLLELEDLAANVDRDLPAQVTLGHGRGDLGDVADLVGQVAGHEVDVVGQVLPGAGHARHDRLATELALGADLASHPGDLGGEGVELVDHRVDDLGRTLELTSERPPVDLGHHPLAEVAPGDGTQDAVDLDGGLGQVGDEVVDQFDAARPVAAQPFGRDPVADPSLGPDHAPDPADLGGHPLVELGDVVEQVRHRRVDPVFVGVQPDAEITAADGLEGTLDRLALRVAFPHGRYHRQRVRVVFVQCTQSIPPLRNSNLAGGADAAKAATLQVRYRAERDDVRPVKR